MSHSSWLQQVFSLRGFRGGAPTVIFLLTVFCKTSFSDKPDFLILGDPASSNLLNQYQQPLTAEEKAALLPNSPFEILQEKRTLGDGLTEASKLKLGYDVVYVVTAKDDKHPAGGHAYRRKFPDCDTIGDTVRIARSGAVKIYPRYPADGEATVLQAGDAVVRVFSYEELHYVKVLGPRPRYGWCSLSTNEFARVAAPAPGANTLRSAILSRVETRIGAVNGKYAQFFGYFNQRTGQDKTIPRWQVGSDDQGVRCTLIGGFNYAAVLQESTDELVQELRTDLLADAMEVTSSNGAILIRERPAPDSRKHEIENH